MTASQPNNPTFSTASQVVSDQSRKTPWTYADLQKMPAEPAPRVRENAKPFAAAKSPEPARRSKPENPVAHSALLR